MTNLVEIQELLNLYYQKFAKIKIMQESINNINKDKHSVNKFNIEEELRKDPDYRNYLDLEHRLKGLILTGEEILQLDLIREPTDREIQESEIYEDLSEKYSQLSKEFLKLQGDYELSKGESSVIILSKIEKIIQGKEKGIIKKIRKILEKK